nr:hypothetical protein [Phytohabitans rumicis]
MQLPAHLQVVAARREREQHRTADHLLVVLALDRPAAGRRDQALVLGGPLLQDQAHRAQVGDRVHRRAQPPGHAGVAVHGKRRLGVVELPRAQDQSLRRQPSSHPPTVAS